VAYVKQAERRRGSCLAARNHCPTNEIRITTYPATMTLLSTWPPWSIDANIAGMPSASTMTPTIWSMVINR
jgi:hypothetical protein